ncbi:hypothetical protein C8J41_11243 [Sphingomonas sp. PP-CC-3G-468]|nr:hypothetical protein C8J41_11243 [Sphingomonas sp. PP-CC-3G-468]
MSRERFHVCRHECAVAYSSEARFLFGGGSLPPGSRQQCGYFRFRIASRNRAGFRQRRRTVLGRLADNFIKPIHIFEPSKRLGCVEQELVSILLRWADGIDIWICSAQNLDITSFVESIPRHRVRVGHAPIKTMSGLFGQLPCEAPKRSAVAFREGMQMIEIAIEFRHTGGEVLSGKPLKGVAAT